MGAIRACIIQARIGSKRLPRKVLLPISGKPMLMHIIERVRRCRNIDKIIIATTRCNEDDAIEELVDTISDDDLSVYRGSEEDVLGRYFGAAQSVDAKIIVRVTGDCPLIDWKLIDDMMDEFVKEGYDYLSNVLTKRTYPRGLDVEIFTFAALKSINGLELSKREREHVTTYIREHTAEFNTHNFEGTEDHSGYRWTVDEPLDMVFVQKVFDELYRQNNRFGADDVLTLIKEKPELAKINNKVEQKENIKNKAN